MTDATVTETAEPETDNCGCCLPPPGATEDKVARLLARRDALDERLAHLELVGAGR